MALGSTQPLTEMSTRDDLEAKGWPARKADTLAAICEPTVQNMWEPVTSHNPTGLYGLLHG
jgi:hypothetical protein